MRSTMDPFVIEVSEEEIRREHAKAKEQRATRWWKELHSLPSGGRSGLAS